MLSRSRRCGSRYSVSKGAREGKGEEDSDNGGLKDAFLPRRRAGASLSSKPALTRE